jgi:hypothetical protein
MRIYLVLLLGIGVACSDDDGTPRDGGAPPPDVGRPPPDTGTPPPDTGGGGVCTPGSCGTGCPCDPARGCFAAGHTCQDNLGGSIGSTTDPIDGFEGSVPAPIFGGGYCTTAPVNIGATPPSCTVGDSASCPSCATCVSLGTVGGIDRTFCARECTPSLTEDECPDSAESANTCLIGDGFCLDGCMGDDECRVFRFDTDGDGDIEAPAMDMTAVDSLEYRATANHRCDAATDRCVHDGNAGARAGDVCTWDGDCEANGDCIYNLGWQDRATPPGRGYCTKFGCDVPGNGCAMGQKCNPRGFGGTAVCLAPCEVGANEGVETDEGYRFNFASGCRPGHRCMWDGAAAMGAADGGSCVPGNYNDVRVSNIGDACTEDGECYSPLGAGRCIGLLRGDTDTCSVSDCGAPGVPADLCGADPDGAGPLAPPATCMQLSTDSFCRVTCATATDCEGETTACMPISSAASLGIGVAHAVCTPFCFGTTQAEADAQCRAGMTCGGAFAPGASFGTCEM